MRITPISPVSNPRWVLAKPHFKIDCEKMELTPIDVQHVMPSPEMPVERVSLWEGVLMAGCGALALYIVGKGIMAILQMGGLV